MFGNSPPKLNRRELIRSASISAGIAAVSTGALASGTSKVSFTHGVASGDPLQTQVILWTRVMDIGDPAKKISGEWQISTVSDFSEITQSGSFKTGPARDYTVKIDAASLQPGSSYYYRFIAGEIISPTGQTKTLPEQTESIDLAVVSCANYSHGYFNVYKEISKRPYQAVLHLGDYIYEYGVGKYENLDIVEQGRVAQPKTEVISLEDYRTRYAQYRTDPDLLAAHAAHPFICVWDDHEVANDTWKDGAENHTDDEGDFKKRQKVAMQAYREWLPIRETANVIDCKIYRSFELAQLGTLIMMDTRHIGRDRGLTYEHDLPMRTIPFDMSDKEHPKAVLSAEAITQVQADHIKHVTVPFKLTQEGAVPLTDWEEIKALDPQNMPKGYTYLPDTEKFQKEILGAENRSILGAEQEKWLEEELAKSTSTNKPWQIIGQQLLAGKLGIPLLADEELDYENSPYITKEAMAFFRMLGQLGMPLNLDAWDGYPACRERVFKSIRHKANNAVFLAGDTHNAWAFNLKDDEGNLVAVELATPSVSSPGLESYIPANPDRVAEELLKVSEELHFIDSQNRGWMEISLTESELNATWQYVSTVLDTAYNVTKGPTYRTKNGQQHLV